MAGGGVVHGRGVDINIKQECIPVGCITPTC